MARVLLVDDDTDILELVKRRVGGAGHRVLAAGSGPEALALVANRGAPEVAVLDVGMPGMSGLELLQRLREATGQPTLPAIFLSARVGEADVARGAGPGRDLPHQAVRRHRAAERDRPGAGGHRQLVAGAGGFGAGPSR